MDKRFRDIALLIELSDSIEKRAFSIPTRGLSNFASSRFGLPIAGGIAGGVLALPSATEDLSEGDTLGGIAKLIGGTGLGFGGGLMGGNILGRIRAAQARTLFQGRIDNLQKWFDPNTTILS